MIKVQHIAAKGPFSAGVVAQWGTAGEDGGVQDTLNHCNFIGCLQSVNIQELLLWKNDSHKDNKLLQT